MEEKINYYLVLEQQTHFDGHGEPEEGKLTKFITTNKLYEQLIGKEGVMFYENPVESFIEDSVFVNIDKHFRSLFVFPEDKQAQDSYHCIMYSYEVSIVSKEMAEKLTEIIKSYKNIN
jgi:hypothetical protein